MAYLGNSPETTAAVNKYEYTATASQTTFACTYDSRVDVYLNGVLLSGTDYTATSGVDIVLGTGATAGDIVQIDAFQDIVVTPSGVQYSVEYTATLNQTVFSATYTPGYIQVFLNGVRLDAADYTATNGTSVTLGTGAALNDVVFILATETFDVANTYTQAQADALFGGAAGATGGGDDEVFVLNDQVVTTDFTVPVGKNASTAGPITVNSGVTVTVSSGSVWHIL